jgi:hypothetical protein
MLARYNRGNNKRGRQAGSQGDFEIDLEADKEKQYLVKIDEPLGPV